MRSIAQLFGSTKSRCGIYLLELPHEKVYIGQASDVVRRFAQHRQNYDEIIGFSFIPVRPNHLDQVERDLIHKTEMAGLVILNTIHASNVVGDTDLDLVVSQEEQTKWLLSPFAFNMRDTTSPIFLPAAQVERFALAFRKFQAHSLFSTTSKLLQTYLHHCLPSPKRTEYSFWVVSCLPSTNRSSWPRLLCVSAGLMELLVLGHHKDSSSEMWGFVNVASDVLAENFATDKALQAAFPSIEITKNQYRDAGQHQLTLFAYDERSM